MTCAGKIDVLHAAADLVGESPLWDGVRNVLWWVDIAGRSVRRRDFATGVVSSLETPFIPGALAFDEDGHLNVAGGTGLYRVTECGSFETIAEVPGSSSSMRMNDGTVDRAGRFWVGTVPLAPMPVPAGSLYRFGSDGVWEAVAGLGTQNGTAISPDGATFYVADSHPDLRVIWAYDFDVEAGSLENRRVFHHVSRGRPDGAAVDADGCYWFAAIDAGLIIRLDPLGREMEAIQLPVSRPTNLAFCGADLSALVVTTMAAGAEGEPLAGSLLTFQSGAKGWPQPRLALGHTGACREMPAP
ncbi:MAG TPA: SMP-30/gluconolactonase/LRE family protein [Pseudorhizobium sp.]|nr:SMP-30/gluconolactonase/LRE family protein [Pseudorhizobium sp.]